MKYFTSEIWKGLQDKSLYEEMKVKWENAFFEYEKQYETLEKRLSPKSFKFFKENSMHDGKIVSIKLFDEYNFNRLRMPKPKMIKQPISVTLNIISGYSDYIYTIEYLNVVKFNFNHSIENMLFDYFNDGLGDIGYDEITEKDSTYLNHEYLFTSGNLLEIEFKKMNVYENRL